MTQYTFGAHEIGTVSQGDFAQLVEVVKGRSIISLLDGDNRFELGVSGNVLLRILLLPNGELEVNCFSTQNADDPLASVFWFGEMPQTIPVRHLEAKLRGLRTAFSIFYLLAAERQSELAQYLADHPFGDIDRALLSAEETLHIESVSYGSWLATIRTKSKAALNAIVAVATIVFPRTRDAFLKKVEADASLKDTQAKREEVALERDKFQLAKEQADYALELVSKIGDAEAQEILNRRLRQAIYELASGDRDEKGIRSVATQTFPPVLEGHYDYRIGRDGTFVTRLSERALRSETGRNAQRGSHIVFRTRRETADFVRAAEARGMTVDGKEYLAGIL